MTIPIKLSTGFSSSNYYGFDEKVESLNTLNTSLKTGKITTSVGVGIDSKYKLNPVFQDLTNKLAVEAKLKYNITDNLNAQARFRKIGDTEQYRVTFGGSYNFNEKDSVYSSAHLTTKNSMDAWSTNTGAWIGWTHNFEKCSLSAEVQQNIPLNGMSSPEKARKINPSDTTFNILLSVPFRGK